MSKIVFFNIPAYGHTNPTISVVNELVKSGCDVTYFSFEIFRERIEKSGALFISCDQYLPQIGQSELDKKAGKDFSALIEMVTETTIAMEDTVLKTLNNLKPDCIVSDSVCFWGKLFAKKLGIAYICSTTTFAFNQYSAKLMKPGLREMLSLFLGMPKINRQLKKLSAHGYPVKRFVDIIQNDNETNTVVYTSTMFQPMSETFSDKYAFVGPTIADQPDSAIKPNHLIYISLGTILNQNINFYQQCIAAFKDSDYKVIMSVGDKTDLKLFNPVPDNFTIKNEVNQIEVLKETDCFITHCGMNSVCESLYFGVPMVLFPQHSEQGIVASQAEALGAGIRLKGHKADDLWQAVNQILNQKSYKINAEKIALSFYKAGGAKAASEFIQSKINMTENF